MQILVYNIFSDSHINSEALETKLDEVKKMVPVVHDFSSF